MSDPTDLASVNVATSPPVVPAAISSDGLFPQLVEHPRQNRTVLLLRDVPDRSMFEKHQTDFELLNPVLAAYEPAIGLDGAD
jgi:hypothetical protein